jgi:hypothetical protein
MSETKNETPWIRVSCGCLCRIEHRQRFLLLINANLRAKGIYRLAPVGGALTFDNPARLAEFGAVPDNPASRDLRFKMSAEALPAFREWFISGTDRERSPLREIEEELVGEAKLLPALPPDAIECDYVGLVEDETFTQRQGQTGVLTHYFLEIFDIKFKRDALLGPLIAAPPESGVAWLTADQLASRGPLPFEVDGQVRQVDVLGYLLLKPVKPEIARDSSTETRQG